MTKPTDLGRNRTGIATSPIDSRRLVEAAEATEPPPGDDRLFAAERAAWSRDAPPVGTMPPPASLKGIAKTALEKLQGQQPTVLLDKLAERLAFERTGARLYDALIVKLDAASVHAGGPTRADLERIRAEEVRHMGVVRDAIEHLGADPTVVTPCADVAGVASLGLVQALSDPRTTLTQGLDTILTAELTDNAAWSLLIELTASMGFDELADRFRVCLAEEEEHLASVRSWLSIALLGQAGAAPTPPVEPSAPRPA